MNSEKKEIVKEYVELLEQGIAILNAKVEELKKQDLDESKMGLFQTYTAQIQKYKNNLGKLNNLSVYDDMKEKLDVLGKSKTLKKDKDEIKAYIMNIISWYKEWEFVIDGKKVIINSDNIATYIDHFEGKIQDLNEVLDILHTSDKEELKNELATKLNDLEVLKKYRSKTVRIEKEIASLKQQLDILENYDILETEKEKGKVKTTLKQLEDVEKIMPNMTSIQETLDIIGNRNVKAEDKVKLIADLKQYINLLEDEEIKHFTKDLDVDFIKLEINKLKNIESKKGDLDVPGSMSIIPLEEKKEEEEKKDEGEKKMEKEGNGNNSIPEKVVLYPQDDLNYVSRESFYQRHKKAICGTLITAIAVGIVGISLNNLIKKDKNANNDGNNEYPTEYIVVEPTPTPNALEGQLINKGYSYEAAVLMARYFDEAAINNLLSMPYDARVETYADAKGFKYEYLREYEETRSIYNITASKTVDYVNRAHILKDYNLFNSETELNDYVEFVLAIDNKGLFHTEFVEASNRLNDTTNTITSHLMDSLVTGVNQITADDINKINALRFIAADCSDLDMCMEKFADIVTGIINDPNNMELREQGFKFVQIFVTSANNFNNTLNSETLIPESEISNVLTGDEAFDEAAKVLDDADWYIAYDGVITPLSYMIFAPGDGEDEDYQKWDDLLFVGEKHLDVIRDRICGNGLVLTQESGE